MQAPAATAKPVTICLDDFGLHPGINEAAIELARSGRISAISCMVGAPAWRDGVSRLGQLPREGADLGLHLDFTEYPLSAANRRPLPVLMALAAARSLDRTALRREIRAQLDAFEQGLDRAPDHVDGHQHVHQFPGIREVLVDVLLERYPHDRPWLRCTRRAPAAPSAGLKPWIIERFGSAGLSSLARAHGFRQNASLLGVYDFRGDDGHYLGLMAQWLEAARKDDVLMCHASVAAAADDPIGAARSIEYGVLSGSAFAALLTHKGARVAPLGRLPHPSA